MSHWPYPHVAAHRGGGRLAPENTLAAIDTGARYGHTMIEFDVKLSADGLPFLLHDDTLDRTTTRHGIAGHLRWEQLRQIDAGRGYTPEFSGVTLPLLADVAARCRHYAMMANIEIKPTTGMEIITGREVALAAQTLWQGMRHPVLSSFSIEALAAAQDAVPELPRGLLLDTWREDWLALVRQLGCVSLHLNHQLLDAMRVAEIKAAGLFILVYTVNDRQRAEALLGWGVDTVCTDAIDQIHPADYP